MNLLVKDNHIYIDGAKYSCAIGKNGITNKKNEGDLCTPTGKYKFNHIYYRLDRIKEVNFLLDSSEIKPDDGWCDDPESKFYNQHIKFPFEASAEALYRDDELYDIICVIDYNTFPIIKGKGSAIFLHAAKYNFESTEGCISIDRELLIKVSKRINNLSTISIES